MDFNPTGEQRQLGDLVQRLLAAEHGFEQRRKILASPQGHSPELWSKLAELGLLSLQVPENHGGMAPAAVETLLTMTALGKFLVLEPYLTSAVMATALLRELGVTSLFSSLASGEIIAAVALGDVKVNKGTLDGKLTGVAHAPIAQVLLVPVGSDVYSVQTNSLQLTPHRTFDGQIAADVVLDGTRAELLGSKPGALEAALDLGVAALCAEAVGALQAALDATVEYTKTRRQFGVPIARFQALQHRMAEMLIHLEQARSMSYLAMLRAHDPDARERRRAVSAAKVIIGQACRYVGQQAVQLHGGMGVTDEHSISHYFKRLLAIELALGDTEHHLDQFLATERT